MTKLPVRAAAIDRALLGDDPRPAFTLVGTLDDATADPLTATMLAITVRRRDVAVEHAAELTGCTPTRLRTAVERGCEKSR